MKNYLVISMLFFLLFSSQFENNIWSQGFEEALQFRYVGPTRGGRVTAVAGVDNQANLFYMGSTGGGVWKSTDYGLHWKNISDGYFASPSIGAIAVYQPNPDIIYVGTGSDAIRSNVIVGKGMYKSTNGGKSWQFIGLKDAGQIGAVLIHPEEPPNVYVAVMGQPFRKSKQRGVYRTTDGGKSWENVLFLSDSVGAVDLEFAPDNPDVIYASMWRAERKPWTIISGDVTGGIFKSTDGGDTWKKITTGLPNGLTGKIDFAVSPAKPERVWAQIEAEDTLGGIYLSDDYAETWKYVVIPDSIKKSIMYRPFYFTNINVNPMNPKNIWVGTKDFWTSYDEGKTWKKINAPHVDFHDLWINPNDTSLMISGDDGGASVSRDGGENWTHQFNQPTAELYSCDVDELYPFNLYSGQQDNTTIRIPSKPERTQTLKSNKHHGLNELTVWEMAGGCETGPVVPKPGNPNVIYANCKGLFRVFYLKEQKELHYYVGAENLYGNHPSDLTYRFQRVTPIEVSPHNPDVVYFGSQYLHRTFNQGETWETISPDLTANIPEGQVRSGGPIQEDITGEEYYSVLYAIQESPVTKGIIWTGSNDGFIYVSKNNGSTWVNVTPSGLPKGGRVQNIDASPHEPGKALIAVNRDYLGDDKPYFYITEDYGNSWRHAVRGIDSDFPARVIREDPKKEGLLFAGTEFGFFISYNNGAHWYKFNESLPLVPVTDLNFVRNSLAVSTLGRGFWVIDDRTSLFEINKAMNNKEDFFLFKPSTMLTGEKLSIAFKIPQEMKDTDSLTIMISRGGQVLKKYIFKSENITMGGEGLYQLNWDGRWEKPAGIKDVSGPFAAPGNYLVKAIYKGSVVSENFKIELHPHLKDAGNTIDDLKAQESLALKVLSDLENLNVEIRRLESQLRETEDIELKNKIKRKLAALKKGPNRYDKPKLFDHMKYLYGMITQTPQKLGKDAFERYKRLSELK